MQKRISYLYNLFCFRVRVTIFFFSYCYSYSIEIVFLSNLYGSKRNFKMIRFGSIIIFRYVPDTSSVSETLNGLTSISSNRSIGSEPLVQRFLKGVFNQRPALTRNSSSFTWDILILLNYLRTLYPLESLSLAQLTNKTVMLLALLTGQRGQTIHALRTVDISLSEFDVKIKYSSRLKTTRPGFHLADVTIEAYKDPELCFRGGFSRGGGGTGARAPPPPPPAVTPSMGIYIPFYNALITF